jgi:hypothetical protein
MSIKKVISEDLRNRLLKLDEKKLDVLAVASQQVKEILISVFNEDIHGFNKSLSS